LSVARVDRVERAVAADRPDGPSGDDGGPGEEARHAPVDGERVVPDAQSDQTVDARNVDPGRLIGGAAEGARTDLRVENLAAHLAEAIGAEEVADAGLANLKGEPVVEQGRTYRADVGVSPAQRGPVGRGKPVEKVKIR